MSRRNITGPQSALTDFLASHNISANRIRQTADERRAAAAAALENEQTEENGEASGSATAEAQDDDQDAAAAEQEDVEDDEVEAGPSTGPRRRGRRAGGSQVDEAKRKKEEKQKAAIEKIKASKAYQKKKRAAKDDDEADDILQAMLDQQAQPLPGQMANCDICDKRFTVTPYSLRGPKGGLLCAPCSKEAGKSDGPPKKKPKKSTGPVGRRRTMQSRIFEGSYHTGAKNLATLCIETLAKNVHLADSLGELPLPVVDKIARLFSKRRLLRPNTLPLFVQASTEILTIYDGAYLTTDDMLSIFQTCSKLRELKIRNAIQFKDEVMDYLLDRNIRLEKFSLHGANLLTEDRWLKFLQSKGSDLKTIQTYHTDRHFSDEVVASLGTVCPNLKRLKIAGNQEVTSEGSKKIADIKGLEHLSLRLQQKPTTKALVHTIRGVGDTLRTLSIKEATGANDEVLTAIKENCRQLSKLRITDSDAFTDEGFVDLFTDWQNPALRFIDFEACRYVDAQKPRDNSENYGLCSNGFKALMRHSRKDIRHLNIASCRHVEQSAFEEVFSGDTVYPSLKAIDVSFCEDVNDFVLGCIFRSCPALHHIKVFGCMKVTSQVEVRQGVMVIGVPNAVGVEMMG